MSYRGNPDITGKIEQTGHRFLAGLKNWPAWLGLLLLFATLEVAVLSLERAEWITPQPALSLVLVLAVAVSWIVTGLRMHAVIAWLTIVLIGGGTAWWLGASPQLTMEREIFSIFLVVLVWFMGAISVWALRRRANPWAGVLSGAVVLVVNLSNLPKDYFYFFGLYFFIAVVFIVQVRISRHTGGSKIKSRERGKAFLFPALAVIVGIGSLAAWLVPQARAPQFQNIIATRLFWMQDIETSSFNIFASVPAKQPLSTLITRGSLGFGSNWHTKDQVDYTIISPYATYWRIQSYDVYTREGWQNSPTTETIREKGTTWEKAGVFTGSGALTYSVTPGIRTDSLPTGGTFVSADIPYVIHESNGQVVAVTAPRVLEVNEAYTMTTAIVAPSAGQLEAITSGYPEDIGNTYLALPEDFPDRIRKLAEWLTEEADTPYEKMIAIDRYLDRLNYKIKIPGPKLDQDGVEYFLFEERAGFCTYFASAMAVMLRAVDVPTRLATGYLPGDPGEKSGEYLLRDNSYHAWTQVWFDGYGWVDIEATPAGESGLAGAVSGESPVIPALDTPQIPEWETWYQQFLFPSSPVATDQDTQLEPKLKTPRGPVFFADELGKALLAIGIIVLALLALLVPASFARAAFKRWIWYVDRPETAVRTYLIMGRLASLVRLGPMVTQTPEEYSAVLAQAIPEQSRNIETITQAFTRRRFARAGDLGLFEEAEILKARCKVYDALLSRLGFLPRFIGRHI